MKIICWLLTLSVNGDGGYIAYYERGEDYAPSSEFYSMVADTAPNALAKLLIHLYEKGVIK